MSKIACLMLLGVVLYGSPAFAGYRVVGYQQSFDDSLGLGRFDVTIQDGSNPGNKFGIARLVKVDRYHLPLLPTHLVGPVVFAPPGASNFDYYMEGGPEQSLAKYLAVHGFDVWGYQPRTSTIPADYWCNSNDCSFMSSWGLDTYVRDLEFIRSIAQVANLGKRPAIGGLSLGGMLGVVSVNNNPNGWSGVFSEDGTIVFYADPVLNALYRPMCEQLKAGVSSGELTADQDAGPFLAMSAGAYLSDPQGASQIIPGVTNEDAMYYVFTTACYGSAPPPDGICEKPGYTYAAGTSVLNGGVQNSLAYSDMNYLARELLHGVNHVESWAVERDYYCMMASDQTPHWTARLGEFHGALLAFENEIGMGTVADPTIALFTHANVTILFKNGYGHLDESSNVDALHVQHEPIYHWLMLKVVPGWN